MATKPALILVLEQDQFTVGRVLKGDVTISPWQAIDGRTLADSSETIARTLQELGHDGEPVLLALGSTYCVSIGLPVPGPRQARKRAAMSFLLEPHLPWPAEEVVSDYELFDGGKRALFAATEAAPLARLVEALEERGIVIASIAPFARLALAYHLRTADDQTSRFALLWRQGETTDLWLVRDGRPTAWRWLAFDAQDVVRALGEIQLTEGVEFSVLGRNLPDDFLPAIADRTGLACRPSLPSDADDPVVAGLREAAQVVQGRREAPLELRRDRLAPREGRRAIRSNLRLLQTCCVLLMGTIGVSMWNQSRGLDARGWACEAAETAVFQRLFPGQRVPVAIRSRLETELARLKGVRGERSDLPESIPFLIVLDRLLRGIPSDMRLRLLELRLENGQIYLVGQVRTHGDADRIADALRRVGLDVAAPNTHRLEKEGVEFRISARLVPSTSKQPKQKTT